MNKKLLRPISLGILFFVMSGSMVDASEQLARPDASYVEMSQEGDVVAVGEVFTEKQMREMCSASEADISSLAAIEPDPYEPNNTMETAYPYSKTERITGALAFNEGQYEFIVKWCWWKLASRRSRWGFPLPPIRSIISSVH